MTLKDFLLYRLWPMMKVRGRFYWWVVRYGGRRNIPPEVVFGSMLANMERLEENLQQALRAMPSDTPEEDRKMLLSALSKTQAMRRDAPQIRRDT
jgi:hypothetical protein